jgi:hypothetical protein
MINQHKLAGCTKDIIAVADVLDSYAHKKGCQLIVSSGARSVEENKAAGGSFKSLHMKGRAIDFYFSDKYNIYEHVTEIYHMVLKQEGVFKGVTQMEVCRGIVMIAGVPTWVNHIHLAFGDEAAPIYFTGVYPK